MSNTLNPSDEERVSMELENFLEFVREILNDPSILDDIPNDSNVDAIPKDQRDPAEHYDFETPRMVAKVTPPSPTEQREGNNT